MTAVTTHHTNSRALNIQAWIHFAIAIITGGAVAAFFHGWWGDFSYFASNNSYQAWSMLALGAVATLNAIEFLMLYVKARVPSSTMAGEPSFVIAAFYLAFTFVTINAAVCYYSLYADYLGWDWHHYPLRVILFTLLIPVTLYLFAKFLNELVLSERRRVGTPSDTADVAFRRPEVANAT